MHSFGHAAYFGLGAYGAALLVKWLGAADGRRAAGRALVALAGALLFGWFAVRLSGVYLAMLTLAFAQIVWSIVFQWEALTGGSQRRDRRVAAAAVRHGLGLLPARAAADGRRRAGCCGACCSRRSATRCGPGAIPPLRAEAIGIDVKRVHWLAFAIAGGVCGLAGGAVRLRQGLDLAGDDQRRPLDRRPGDGAARRHPDADRPDRRRLGVRLAAGHGDAADRILARAARRHDPAAGARVPAGHRRQPSRRCGASAADKPA